ncbi:MerR family transcriptional regulator [Ensifer sp. IC4062]|nr:MerR family transcriptional regulator [Ensifer sp. IC4062]
MPCTTDGNQWLTAAECGERLGLTVRRLYENRGLISPRRTGKNWRLYGAEEFARLNEFRQHHLGVKRKRRLGQDSACGARSRLRDHHRERRLRHPRPALAGWRRHGA